MSVTGQAVAGPLGEHTVVAARVHGEADLADVVRRSGRGLGATNGTGDVRVAHLELVVVGGEGLQLSGLHLGRVVDVGAGEEGSGVDDVLEGAVGRDLEGQADGGVGGRRDVLVVARVDGHRVIQRHQAGGGAVVVGVVELGGASRPEDDGGSVGVSGRNAVGEVQPAGIVGGRGAASLGDLGDGDAQAGVVERRTAVVEVARVRGGGGRRGQRDERERAPHGRRERRSRSSMDGQSAAFIYIRLTRAGGEEQWNHPASRHHLHHHL